MLQLLGKCFCCSAFYITAGRLVEMYQPEKTFARVDKRSKISNIAVMCGDFHRPPTTTTTTTINKTTVSIQLSSKCFPISCQ